MQEENEPSLPATWTDVAKTLAEGGLPQMLAGPAGKAISRLVAGVTDIPAAWLERRAQRIKDETLARSTIMKAVAKASADAAVANPDLLDRALERHIAEIYRKQETREEIAQRTIENLAAEPPPEEQQEGPSDDWMNVFERLAENASSDRMKDLWSKILAGEIRQPQSISLATLNFFSIMDHRLAVAIEEVFQWVIFGDSLPLQVTERIDLQTLLLMRDGGLVAVLDSDMRKTLNLNPPRAGGFKLGKDFVVATANVATSVAFQTITLTRIGKEIYDAIRFPTSPEVVSLILGALTQNEAVSEVTIGPHKDYPQGRLVVFKR